MNAIPNGWVHLEEEAEVMQETEDGLVEVGAVTETKGGPLGSTHDLGNGWTWP